MSPRRGSGIGLAVADEIVTAHLGELIVESELGSGTTVTIKIPTAKKYEALSKKRHDELSSLTNEEEKPVE
jgi:signal transduction histidine kinase